MSTRTPAPEEQGDLTRTATTAAAATGERLLVAFAASLDGQGPCRQHAVDGCDIYLATYNLLSRTVESVVPVVRTPGVSEDFPVLDPQGRFVVYQRGRGQAQHDLAYAVLGTGESETLVARAREPAISPDGRFLAYTTEEEGRTFSLGLRPLSVSASGRPAVGEHTALTSVDGSTEPYFLPGGDWLAYYRKGEGPRTGQTRLLRQSTREDQPFSEADGCAHGAVSPDGLRMFCQSGVRLYARTRSSPDGAWGEPRVLQFPAAQDEAFSHCGRVTFGHAEFCGSSDVLLATYSCMEGEEYQSAQLMLFSWSGEWIAPFSRQVAASLGRTGEARSGACGVHPEGDLSVTPAAPAATASAAVTPIAAGASGVVELDVPEVGRIAVEVVVPTRGRYAEGAPLVVVVPPFFTPSSGFPAEPTAEDLGMIRVSLLWPGRSDRGRENRSEGEDDYGGEGSTRALREVLLYAAGQRRDTSGATIQQRVAIPVVTENVGLYAFSHPGIAATNVLAHHGEALRGRVKYLIGNENPTHEALSAVELGHFEQNTRVQNPAYSLAQYRSDGLAVDYSTVGWLVNSEYPDGRPYFGPGQTYVLSDRIPQMWGKRYYSTALLQALRDNGALSADRWPADLATPEEAAAAWASRSSVRAYPLLAGQDLGVGIMLVFASQEHVQPSLDAPNIHHAYDGFHKTADLWVRLNPDKSYIEAVLGSSVSFSEHPANTEPASWQEAALTWGYDKKVIPGGRAMVTFAALAEMADRAQAGRWDPDLTATLFPTTAITNAGPDRAGGRPPPRGTDRPPPPGDRPRGADKPPLSGDKPRGADKPPLPGDKPRGADKPPR